MTLHKPPLTQIHDENSERIAVPWLRLTELGLVEKMTRIDPRHSSSSEFLKVHNQEYISLLEETANPVGRANYDKKGFVDVYISEGSFKVHGDILSIGCIVSLRWSDRHVRGRLERDSEERIRSRQARLILIQ